MCTWLGLVALYSGGGGGGGGGGRLRLSRLQVFPALQWLWRRGRKRAVFDCVGHCYVWPCQILI